MRQLVFLFFISAFLSVTAQNFDGQLTLNHKNSIKGKQAGIVYTYKIVAVKNNTWCYDIYKNSKMLIHQTSIPGVPGNDGFKTKSDAKKVARIVIEKLKKGEMPPSVTIDEMKKLKVL